MEQDLSRVWAERFAACEASGLSQADFCRREGLSLSSFYQWKTRLKRRGTQQLSKKPEIREIRGHITYFKVILLML
ncbi:MAG: hypothetical protein A2527_14505 [Candidatus Lambdaproteobacteria bacterium RIFOXYD2_FULL_50_16]|uniref:Transposase n=1 Tax=Candidatus Lambdaproteobacteria bacterium RIFOXYD2_FULL_50_16 TaxID=1817772 RepID=A0A1F6G839_9PROT|nr:MAG: hypothetical protein A2527_14505 [Candidatus Lambdaproteobacteria bacterium RIFOXYD2_FULL_50_16]